MEIQTLDTAGIQLIARFEGCILHPYKDQAGIPTIGIGMTYYPETGKKVTMHDASLKSVAEAYRQFGLMARPKCLAVYSTTRDNITQNQFNALVSLTYNIGESGYKGSTVHRMVNAGVTGPDLQAGFLMWVKADGRVVPDLVARRKLEYQTYMKSE